MFGISLFVSSSLGMFGISLFVSSSLGMFGISLFVSSSLGETEIVKSNKKQHQHTINHTTDTPNAFLDTYDDSPFLCV